jgi:hypothetical protein
MSRMRASFIKALVAAIERLPSSRVRYFLYHPRHPAGPPAPSPVDSNQSDPAVPSRSRKYSFQLSGNSFTPNARRTARISASPYLFMT